jgi:drug/metabolite transporter (DMT)-like permease
LKPLQLILLVLMNCCWAASYTVFKELSPWLNPGSVATLRFGISGLVMLCCWPWLPGLTPRGRDLARAILIGLATFVLGPRLQVAGVQLGSAAGASVLLALEPLIVSVSAGIFLREPIGPRRWIGFAFGLSGVLLMAKVSRSDFHWSALMANVLVVLSFFCDSVYSVVGKPLLARAGLLKILAVALIAGTAANLCLDGPHTIRCASALPGRAWLLVAFLSVVCTLAGYWLWFAVIREAPVSTVALTVFVQPLAGIVIAVEFLRESVRWAQLSGALAIFAGIAIGLSRQIQHSRNAPEGTSLEV